MHVCLFLLMATVLFSIIANNVIKSENSPGISCQLEFNRKKKNSKTELLNGISQNVNYIQFKLV